LLWRPYIRHIQLPGTTWPLEPSEAPSGAATSDPVVVADAHWRAHGWDPGPYFRAALSIYRTNEQIRVFNESALTPHGLTRSRHEALAVLYFSRHGEMPLGRLSTRLLVHPTSVTSTVDALERLGLVERVAHPTDRRTTLARITPTGRQAMEQSCRMMADGSGGLWALSQHQAGRLFTILKQVRAEAGDLERGAGAPTTGSRDPIVAADRNWKSRGWGTGNHFRASLPLYRTDELIRQSNEAALDPHGLTRSRHEALAVLYFSRHGEMPLGRLGARLLVHPTSVTSTVDTLERLGHVRRVAHPTDRRATLARITPKGRRAIEASNRDMVAARFGLGALDEARADEVFAILSKVRREGIEPATSAATARSARSTGA
jgi:DNA-binding MarR family transcriptional regulator